ncbi:hypothetical protein DFP72DRAFT_869013 [Ephemerocybe angulata]|uniref:Uncharacterized protein n=1 Tax=Ephemerocybe angulata TaxID=980116 RepID=A0A8H6IIB4_9AGAR|nr:hypothetical protein DFP72DRAFT_869013 [Tulosesus angulatus]
MVQLILSSTKGNQGGKYFPYTGFLGLTPVRVEGIVRTKLDTDLKLLPCTSLTISVRCYEQRLGRVTVQNSKFLVDHTQVLWLKPDDVEYGPVGVLEYPFRITLPPSVGGFSTAVFVDYRCTWRVEAVLSHVPITGVGSRQIRHFELPLTRFDLPNFPSLPRSPVSLDQCTNKPRAPRIRYSIEPPSTAVGPSETVSIPLRLQPTEPNVTIKSASMVIERRIHLHDPQTTPIPIPIPKSAPQSSQSSPATRSHSMTPPSASPHTPHTPSPPPLSASHGSYFSSPQHNRSLPAQASPSDTPASSSHQLEPADSTTSLASSQPTITPNTVNPSTASFLSYNSESSPLLASSNAPPQQIPAYTPQHPPLAAPAPISSTAKVVVNPIVGTETDSFSRDPRGVWSQALTLEWPTSKSHSRWAIGETISSDLVSVKYFIRVKISVSSPGGGTDSIELGERELLVVSTSETERVNAQTTYAELIESGRVSDGSGLRSKSKSPRRLRPADRDDLPPSPAPYRGGDATGRNSGSGVGSSSQPHGASAGAAAARAKAPRRPHTSAGPRDKPSFGAKEKDPHKKRRSEVGWGAMGLPIGLGMSEPGVSVGYVPQANGSTGGSGSGKGGEMAKKARSSSSGKLSSSSFWAVTAPPLKNHSSSSSSGRGGVRSGGAAVSESSVSTTASSHSSVASSRRSFKGRKGESSAEEDGEEGEFPKWYHGSHGERPRTAPKDTRGASANGVETVPRGMGRPPPSSFNPGVVNAAVQEGGERRHAVREWEEELVRIEEKSRKESDAAGFGARVRKRSFVSTMRDLLPGRGKMFNLGGDEGS